MNAIKKVIFILPTVVLIGIAANQFRLAFQKGLTPWKGGGFGMFSTVDTRSARFLHYTATIKRGGLSFSLPLVPSIEVEEIEDVFRSLPTREKLQEIVKELQQSLYVFDNPTERSLLEPGQKLIAIDPRDVGEDEEVVRISEFTVEFWRYSFDGKENELRKSLSFRLRGTP